MKKLLLLVLTVLTVLPFFHVGLFDVHDSTSAFRIYTLVETIKAGQFPAAWSNLLNFGYGYPLHLYYAPLFSYLGVFVHLFFGSYETVVKLVLGLFSLIGGYGIYKLLEKKGFSQAILGVTAYLFLPYRASSLYVRGSYAEFLAMSLLPWVIYFWQKPQSSTKAISATAIITALFVLSHNTLPILALPILLLLVGLYQTQYLKNTAFTFLLIFGLTSWFILPIIFERSFVQVDNLAVLTNYRDHFVTLTQLWSSPWGYGGSAAGVAGDSMSFMIGKGQLLLSLLGIFALTKLRQWKSLILFGSIFFLGIFLSLPVSAFVYQLFPLLSVMQFPWRSLAVVSLGAGVLASYSLHLVPKKLVGITSLILCVILIYTNLRYFKPQDYRRYTPAILVSQANLDPLVKDKIPEYLPVWMPSFPTTKIIDGLSRDAVSVSGQIDLTDHAYLTLSTAYMPQWQLQVDGKRIPIVPSQAGLITTISPLSPGSHSLNLTWHRTIIEQLGLLISALSILLVIRLLLI